MLSLGSPLPWHTGTRLQVDFPAWCCLSRGGTGTGAPSTTEEAPTVPPARPPAWWGQTQPGEHNVTLCACACVAVLGLCGWVEKRLLVGWDCFLGLQACVRVCLCAPCMFVQLCVLRRRTDKAVFMCGAVCMCTDSWGWSCVWPRCGGVAGCLQGLCMRVCGFTSFVCMGLRVYSCAGGVCMLGACVCTPVGCMLGVCIARGCVCAPLCSLCRACGGVAGCWHAACAGGIAGCVCTACACRSALCVCVCACPACPVRGRRLC